MGNGDRKHKRTSDVCGPGKVIPEQLHAPLGVGLSHRCLERGEGDGAFGRCGVGTRLLAAEKGNTGVECIEVDLKRDGASDGAVVVAVATSSAFASGGFEGRDNGTRATGQEKDDKTKGWPRVGGDG
jgi:hypothetical protein